jgi:hypothetical protein
MSKVMPKEQGILEVSAFLWWSQRALPSVKIDMAFHFIFFPMIHKKGENMISRPITI